MSDIRKIVSLADKDYMGILSDFLDKNFNYFSKEYTFSQVCSIVRFHLETEHDYKIGPKDYGMVKAFVRDKIKVTLTYERFNGNFDFADWRIIHGSEVGIIFDNGKMQINKANR